jgi:hypothetical protein
MAGSNPGHFCCILNQTVIAMTVDSLADERYSPSFFLRWPSVRSRNALSLMKPAASR